MFRTPKPAARILQIRAQPLQNCGSYAHAIEKKSALLESHEADGLQSIQHRTYEGRFCASHRRRSTLRHVRFAAKYCRDHLQSCSPPGAKKNFWTPSIPRNPWGHFQKAGKSRTQYMPERYRTSRYAVLLNPYSSARFEIEKAKSAPRPPKVLLSAKSQEKLFGSRHPSQTDGHDGGNSN